MSKSIPHTLLFILWLSAAIGHTARGQSIEPLTRPNHYIVLIDASGSTVGTKGGRKLYEEVLTRRLLARLYHEGFGQVVPPYEPQWDHLTLHHFGVVTGPMETANERLREYDLLNDFIHPILISQGGVEEAHLKAKLFPTQTYQYTILTWAKQLALHHSRSDSPKSVRHRTFMIMVSDGHPNDYSTKGEMEMVRRGAREDKYKQVESLISSIDRDYQFTDGRGNQGPAWTKKVPDDVLAEAPRFFIEAYEVIPTAQAKWEAQGVGLRPLDDLRLRWAKETGESPQGVLTARLSEEFVAWIKSAEHSEVSLTAGPNGQLGAGSGLETSVFFREALTCAPLTFDTSLNVRLQRSDKWLGTRIVNYTHRQTVAAPPPLRCTAAFAVWAGLAALLGVLALLALAYYFYYRFRATHLEIEIPGTLAPIRLERRGQRKGRAPVVPQSGLEALSLKLPHQFKQWLLYRGATITLGSEDGEELLGWSNEEGLAQIRLPLAQKYVLAHWRRLPAKPTTVTINFRQGSQRADVDLIYPRALTESAVRSNAMNEKTVYVALDLGSESMAAYYEDTLGNGGMIKLQVLDVAEKLLEISGGSEAEKPNLLMEGEAGGLKISPRLWNRISFKDQAQPNEPGDDHAKLCFVTSPKETGDSWEVSLEQYKQSLFKFFHTDIMWPPHKGTMPNPKILFQEQVMKILSSANVEAIGGGRVNLSPEMLIKHLTLQVLNNFVLNSPELKSYERRNIHLTISVPNVYSLPHCECIKEFVRENLADLAGVEVLSESDAIAYYALKTPDKNDRQELKQFKQTLFNEIERSKEICLVTIDIGKGTTDLSCVLRQKPKSGRSVKDVSKRRSHSVQGRTGKSSGGSSLNYLFAKHYDNRLGEAFQNIRSEAFSHLPFGFIRQPSDNSFIYPQLKAVSALEKLIERVKQSMTEDYEINERLLSQDKQREMLKPVINEILSAVDIEWKEKSEEEQRSSTLWPIREQLINALVLPAKLEESGQSNLRGLYSWFKNVISWFDGKLEDGGPAPTHPVSSASGNSDAEDFSEGGAAIAPKPSPLTMELKGKIAEYVRDNVDYLLDSLKNLVREHQAVSNDRVSIDSTAFVVVAGQASQFKPLRARIRMKCKDMGINDDHILLMEGKESKEACCKGVVNFWTARMLHTNPNELHGTYGCLDYNEKAFKAFDMGKVKSSGSHKISFEAEGTHLVVFTPRSYEEVRDHPPVKNDGATALIDVFSGESEFRLEYDREHLELKINGRKLSISGFGDVSGSIYEKTWPEILDPYKD